MSPKFLHRTKSYKSGDGVGGFDMELSLGGWIVESIFSIGGIILLANGIKILFENVRCWTERIVRSRGGNDIKGEIMLIDLYWAHYFQYS